MFGMTQPDEKDPETGALVQPPAQIPNTVSASPSPAATTVGATPTADTSGAAGGGAVSPQPEQGGPQMPDLTGSGGNAGTIVQVKAQQNPDALLEAGERALSTVQKTVDNKDDNKGEIQKLTKGLGVSGKTIEQLRDQVFTGYKRAEEDGVISAEHHTKLKDRWKNIFKYIGEDEMGLFLIDFGLRAMMAGESMGNLGALGAAGSGALGALQGRRRAVAEQENQLMDRANKQALDQYGAESERMRSEGALMQGRAAEKTADFRMQNRGFTGEKTYLEDFYRGLGYSDDEIGQIFAGAASKEKLLDMTLEDVRAQAARVAQLEQGLPAEMRTKIDVPGVGQVDLSTATNDELVQYSEDIVRRVLDARKRLRSTGGEGALREQPSNKKNKTADDYLSEQQ